MGRRAGRKGLHERVTYLFLLASVRARGKCSRVSPCSLWTRDHRSTHTMSVRRGLPVKTAAPMSTRLTAGFMTRQSILPAQSHPDDLRGHARKKDSARDVKDI